MDQKNNDDYVGALAIAGISGVPAPLGKPAFNAFSRLISGLVDIPITYLSGYREKIEDRNQARRQIRQAIAQKAIASGTENGLIEYTSVRFLSEELEKGFNRYDIAQKAAKILSNTVDDEKESEKYATENAEIDNDWLNKFVRYAEDISSEKAQQVWAKVLAGEITRPGSFSVATLRFLSELDSKTAARIDAVFSKSLGKVIPKKLIGNGGDLFSSTRILEEKGLLEGLTGGYAKPLAYPDGGAGLIGRNFWLRIKSEYPQDLMISPAIFLTEIGEEIAEIISPTDELEVAEHIYNSLPHDKVTSCFVVSLNKNRLPVSVIKSFKN